MVVLAEYMKRQQEAWAKEGRPWNKKTLVFPNKNGSFARRAPIDRSLKKMVKKASLDEVTFHGLRHIHASTLLLHNINPKIVSERLGHASVKITLDKYFHVLPTIQTPAVRVLED